MLVSILHRVTGHALAFAGGILFTWWLIAAATSGPAYDLFYHLIVAGEPDDSVAVVTNVLARIVGVGLTWSLFQHLFSGLRHLVLDTGAGYELKANRRWAILTLVGSVLLTVLLWSAILLGSH
jgi:succinate dehydrogenase / fumarate reductase cytochrome b subunit